MTRKWTPGPWVWSNPTTDGIPNVIDPYMCQGDGFVEVSDANAHLIAAAPDLYEALKCWVEEEEGKGRSGTISAYAALAKARGEL